MEKYGFHILAIIYFFIAAAIASLFWFARRISCPQKKAAVMGVLDLLIFTLPLIFPSKDHFITAAAALLCCIFPLKLFNAYLNSDYWSNESFSTWLKFIFNPYHLVWEKRNFLPTPGITENLKHFARGALEMAAGIILWKITYKLKTEEYPFALDYLLMLFASYLFLWDGGCVTVVAVWRLLGGRCVELCVHPIIASTPADFWRRYNRWVGQFVHECIFKNTGGMKKPFKAVFMSFLFMGILHEYVVIATSGTFRGYMLLFFAINGIAVSLTFRLKPKGVRRILGCILTMAFISSSSILVYLAVRQMDLL